MARYETISFLSDFGLVDEFVGVVHSVIGSIAPQARIVDVTHGVPRHDVRAGGLVLARSAQYLMPGVALAVVDPGVGSERRPVAVEVGGGMSVLVGPDNGLLAPAVALVGGADRAVVLDNPEYHVPAPGPTFDGRDLFGPVAAHLCNGVPFESLGTLIDPGELMPQVMPVSVVEDGTVQGEVLWVDHFGNAQLNIDPESIADLGDRLWLEVDGRDRLVERVGSYAAIAPGGLGLLLDSYGMLSIAADRVPASVELDLEVGVAVSLRAAADGAPGTGVDVGVQLRTTGDR